MTNYTGICPGEVSVGTIDYAQAPVITERINSPSRLKILLRRRSARQKLSHRTGRLTAETDLIHA
jgi:hypothetical protein